MKRLSLAAALLAAVVVVSLSFGSSHREAPNIMLDPTADNTDLYAFTTHEAPGALTIAANWIPGDAPANGPNFNRFDDRARYYINIDNTGDGKPELRYRFSFETKVSNPNSFLYALPGVESIDDEKLNVRQSYDIVREKYRNGSLTDAKVIARSLPVAPANVGPKTIPDYHAVAVEAVQKLKGGGKVFAGPRDDPFFVDLGATFDGINIRKGTGNEGAGKDDFAGLNTWAIVLQLPERQVTKDGKPARSAKADNAVVGVWSTTERRSLQVTGDDSREGSQGSWVQISRLGNPLINEVVIPLGKKDQFNRTTPDRDAELYGKYAVQPELAAVMNVLFDVKAPEKNRADIVQALLQGLPGLNQQVAKSPPAVDTLKINLGVDPIAASKRFGAVAGDTAGFPNGRRLADDVVDIELQVVAGLLKENKVPLGDGVDRNDKPFFTTFPYLASPTSGFDSDPANRKEAEHDAVPAGGAQ